VVLLCFLIVFGGVVWYVYGGVIVEDRFVEIGCWFGVGGVGGVIKVVCGGMLDIGF
jgi:hypothetical protein